MPSDSTYRHKVREIALDNHGYVTTRQAKEVGVPAGELPKLAARGGLESIAYGLYRVADLPPTPFSQEAEALRRVGEGAYLYGESVLALLELGHVNPRRIRVATQRRSRAALPPFVERVRVPSGERTTVYEGLEAQPLARAILSCQGRIDRDRLQQVARQGREQGFLSRHELSELTEQLAR